MELEKREYDRESTNEEIELLKTRVKILDEDTVYYREVPEMSSFQIDIMFEKVRDLMTCEGGASYLIIDLSETKPPNAALRAHVRTWINSLENDILHMALFTEKNLLITLVAKFVVGAVVEFDTSVHQTKEAALKAIEKAKNK